MAAMTWSGQNKYFTDRDNCQGYGKYSNKSENLMDWVNIKVSAPRWRWDQKESPLHSDYKILCGRLLKSKSFHKDILFPKKNYAIFFAWVILFEGDGSRSSDVMIVIKQKGGESYKWNVVMVIKQKDRHRLSRPSTLSPTGVKIN